MAGHGQKCSPDQTRPEGVRLGERPRVAEREVEDAEFVAGGCSHLRHFSPAAGDAAEQQHKCCSRADEIEHKLDHVGPDDCFHPALEGVEQRQPHHQHHRETRIGAKRYADDLRDRRDANAFGQRAGY